MCLQEALQTLQGKLKTNNQIIHSELRALWTSAEFWIRLERGGGKGIYGKKQTFLKGQEVELNLYSEAGRGEEGGSLKQELGICIC